jgi:hypothetical protein
MWYWLFGYLWDRILHGEARFYQGMLIRCQSYHGDYVCTIGRVAMSGGDEMDSYTRVPTARCAWGLWPCPVIPGSKCHHLLRLRWSVKSIWYMKVLDGVTGCSGSSWVGEGRGLGRQVAKSCLPMSTIMRKIDGMDCSRVQFFLGWWPLIFS